jgi:hypothetical protein
MDRLHGDTCGMAHNRPAERCIGGMAHNHPTEGCIGGVAHNDPVEGCIGREIRPRSGIDGTAQRRSPERDRSGLREGETIGERCGDGGASQRVETPCIPAWRSCL